MSKPIYMMTKTIEGIERVVPSGEALVWASAFSLAEAAVSVSPEDASKIIELVDNCYHAGEPLFIKDFFDYLDLLQLHEILPPFLLIAHFPDHIQLCHRSPLLFHLWLLVILEVVITMAMAMVMAIVMAMVMAMVMVMMQ